MIEVKPGQIWLGDERFPYQDCYKGQIAYVIMSKEPDELCWKVAAFQEWKYGAQICEYTAEEINKMEYVGCLEDINLINNYKNLYNG